MFSSSYCSLYRSLRRKIRVDVCWSSSYRQRISLLLSSLSDILLASQSSKAHCSSVVVLSLSSASCCAFTRCILSKCNLLSLDSTILPAFVRTFVWVSLYPFRLPMIDSEIADLFNGSSWMCSVWSNRRRGLRLEGAWSPSSWSSCDFGSSSIFLSNELFSCHHICLLSYVKKRAPSNVK